MCNPAIQAYMSILRNTQVSALQIMYKDVHYSMAWRIIHREKINILWLAHSKHPYCTEVKLNNTDAYILTETISKTQFY